jgi:hypothetical protein
VLVGFNYPVSYNAFGSQIGPNLWVSRDTWSKYNRLEAAGELSSIPLPPLFDHVDRNLSNLKAMGIKVVRWFLLGNGNNYGPTPFKVFVTATGTRDSPPPIQSSNAQYYTKYKFVPPAAVDRRFRRDFSELLSRFRKAGLQIIPSLISFEFAGDLVTGPGANSTWYAGRADAIRDPGARKLFLDTMLAEMLTASKGFEKEIFAWEVINEPIWCCIRFGPLSPTAYSPRQAEVTVDEMKVFLGEAVARIEKAGFPSTVGHRYFDDLTSFPVGTVPQFHYYAADHWYNSLGGGKNDPKMKDLFKGRPKPVLGEFAPVPFIPTKDEAYASWTYEPYRTDSTLARLRLLESEGCDLALIWPDVPDKFDPSKYDAKDHDLVKRLVKAVVEGDILKLTSKARSEIVAYTGGRLPLPGE